MAHLIYLSAFATGDLFLGVPSLSQEGIRSLGAPSLSQQGIYSLGDPLMCQEDILCLGVPSLSEQGIHSLGVPSLSQSCKVMWSHEGSAIEENVILPSHVVKI